MVVNAENTYTIALLVHHFQVTVEKHHKTIIYPTLAKYLHRLNLILCAPEMNSN